MPRLADVQAARAKAAACKYFVYFSLILSFFATLPFCTVVDLADELPAGLQHRLVKTDLNATAIEHLLSITVQGQGGVEMQALVHRGERRANGDGGDTGIRLSTSSGVLMVGGKGGKTYHDDIFAASLQEAGFEVAESEVESGVPGLPLTWEMNFEVLGMFDSGTFACADPTLIGTNTCDAPSEREVD
jgi:hypothetical protein